MSGASNIDVMVGVIIASAIVAAIWLAMRGQAGDQAIATEIDRGVMADYCRLVGGGRYAEAWDTCLSASYRTQVPRDKFVGAHERRRTEYGALDGCRLIRADLHRNLFSKTRELYLLYELAYPGRVEREYAKVEDADGSWRIEATYHLTAADTFDFLLW